MHHRMQRDRQIWQRLFSQLCYNVAYQVAVFSRIAAGALLLESLPHEIIRRESGIPGHTV